MNWPTTICMRWWTMRSAAISSGSATRKRTCASKSNRKGTATAWPTAVPSAIDEDQQRQPGEEGDDHDPPAHQLEPVARQMGAAEQLEQRAAEDEREVLGLGRHGAIPGER